MSDLISRQAAIDAITDELMPSSPLSAVIRAKNRLKELPPAEPQIIHCKDCKHRDKYGCCKYWVGLTMGISTTATDDDDFCSYAKRRTNE